jgi:hypothetical protein
VKPWINAAAFELVWVCAVAGAGRGWWWPGPLAVAVFALWQLRPGEAMPGDATLVAVAFVIGLVADTLLLRSGLLRYATAEPLSGWAPVWILALWVNFALTLNHSLGFLRRHLWLAALLGALGAPCSYWAAARGWQAVEPAAPALRTFVVIALGWGLTLPLLAHLARVLSGPRPAMASVSRGAP